MMVRWFQNHKWFPIFFLGWMVVASHTVSAGIRTVDFGGEKWEQLKGKHFVVYYHASQNIDEAKAILREAEEFYRKIGDAVGFTRYSDYWTWEQRAKIFIFSDQNAFMRRTGAPKWSMGYADRDSFLFQSRVIVTYQQEAVLLDELLPHEIAHLILHDFIPLSNLPVWIDEGIAQLYEKNKYHVVDQMMRVLVPRGQYLPFDFLNNCDIRREKNAQRVELFYAQSLSVIRFLREEHGKESFRQFCRNLRDKKPVEEALRSAYSQKFRSLKDLEDAWVAFISNTFRK